MCVCDCICLCLCLYVICAFTLGNGIAVNDVITYSIDKTNMVCFASIFENFNLPTCIQKEKKEIHFGSITKQEN